MNFLLNVISVYIDCKFVLLNCVYSEKFPLIPNKPKIIAIFKMKQNFYFAINHKS